MFRSANKKPTLSDTLRHHPDGVSSLNANPVITAQIYPRDTEARWGHANHERGFAYCQVSTVFWGGAPSGFRTPDPLIKSQLLYQLS